MDQIPTTPAAIRRNRHDPRAWSARDIAPFAIVLLLCAGCASNTVATYDELAAAMKDGEEVDVGALRSAFAGAPDYLERLESISGLETQVIRLIEEEPLRLGPLGSAIVDQYPASLAGHQALAAFYSYLEREDTAREHRGWVSRIRATVEASGDGSLQSPLPVISPAEPNAYLIATGRSPVGSIYVPTDEAAFLLNVAAKSPEGRIENVYFDLGAVYAGALDAARENEDGYHPVRVMVALAHRNDSAAQTLLGSLSFDQGRLDDATRLLTTASRSGNLIAHIMLARTYWYAAMDAAPGPERDAARLEVVSNYERGIDLGSDEAMYELGRLYAWGMYGEDLRERGLELLTRAADLDNSMACLFLARRFDFAQPPDQPDYDRSEEYYLRAASLDNGDAKIDYARFLMREEVDKAFTDQAYRWLTRLANNGGPCGEPQGLCAQAKVQLGNLFARGVHVRQSYRKARSWFRAAVAASPEHAEVVNDVAWTLTVSNLERLRDERYALKIMDHVMTRNERARGIPAYIDTWAATYAANGDFERAIELQREALNEALNGASSQRTDEETVEILRQHLQDFEAGRTITEAIP